MCSRHFEIFANVVLLLCFLTDDYVMLFCMFDLRGIWFIDKYKRRYLKIFCNHVLTKFKCSDKMACREYKRNTCIFNCSLLWIPTYFIVESSDTIFFFCIVLLYYWEFAKIFQNVSYSSSSLQHIVLFWN